MNKLTKKIAVALLSIISVSCLSGTLAACSKKSSPVETPDETRTVRYAAPTDGSLPTAHTALENVGYLAYVLDNQPFYHAYANNSSKAMGYEQITQSWRDYKSQALTNVTGGVTIASDITYSTFVRAGTQACFIGTTDAYMRSSSKPDKNTTATTASWSTDQPTYYDRETYLTKYGEFSTEISVYLITAETISSSSEVTVNDDGTYSLTLSLSEEAACWYQYGMKTRGSLKSYPTFESIELTLTFDSSWQILETYCVEKTKIAPSALGGINTDSTAKTTTTFSYSSDDFDEEHFGYYESYYKQYVGNVTASSGEDEEDEPELITVLGGGFSGVLTESGQQFDISLSVGSNSYDGKIYLSIPDMDDILSSIDVRVALGKSGSGSQDLYISFSGGNINAYYSDDFALTASVDSLSTIISQVSEFISSFNKTTGVTATSKSLTAAQTTALDLSGIDFNDLLSSFSFEYTDTSVTIALKTDDLLGTGIGADIALYFSRTIAGGSSTYAFTSASINSISYNSTAIELTASITPDSSSSTISHNAASAPANLADYVSGLFGLLGSDTIAVNLTIDGSGSDVMSYFKGVTADVTSYLVLGSDIALRADMSLGFAGITAELTAYYSIDTSAGDYGTVYINLTKINGVDFNAKAYCDVEDMVSAVKSLIKTVTSDSSAAAYAYGVTFSDGEADSVAQLINKILNLNFSKLLSGLYASSSQIRVNLDLDELFSALGLDIGVEFGTAGLALNSGDPASMNLSLPALGLTAAITASSAKTVTLSDSAKEQYLDLTALVKTVDSAAAQVVNIMTAKDAYFNLSATLTVEGVEMKIEGTGEINWSDGSTVAAVNATLSIAESGSESANSVNVRLVYNSSLTSSSAKPYLRLAVGESLLEVYGKSAGATALKAAASTYSTSSGDILSTVASCLQDENIAQLLSIILTYAAQLDVIFDETDFDSLTVKYGTSGLFTVTTDNTLACSLTLTDGEEEGGTSLALSANIKLGSGSYITSLGTELDGFTNIYTAANDNLADGLYGFILSVIDGSSISELIGSDTYAVEISLVGDNSGIEALAGVNVAVTLEYCEIAQEAEEGGTEATAKLLSATADVEFAVNGETVEAQIEIKYYNQCVYLTVKSISYGDLAVGDIGLSVRAGADSISKAVEKLLGIISDLAEEETAQAETFSKATVYSSSSLQSTISTIAGIICGIIETDTDSVFTYENTESGVKTLKLDVDGLLTALSLSAPEIGTVTIEITTGKSIKAYAALENKDSWLTLTAEKAENTEATVPDDDDYIDLDDLLINVDVIYDTVKATISEVSDIQKAQSLVFNVDGVIAINGTGIGVKGSGEVDWSDSAVRVAAELELYVADGNSTTASVPVKLIYDGTKYNQASADEKDPYLVLAIDTIVLYVCYGDNFDGLISSISSLMGTEATSETEATLAISEDEIEESAEEADSGSLLATLSTILENKDVQSVIRSLLQGLSFAVEAVEGDDGATEYYTISAALGDNVRLTYSAADGLNAELNLADDNSVFTFDLTASVAASDGEFARDTKILNEINAEGSEYSIFSMKNFTESFTHLVYSYLYKAITSVNLADFLGSNTYLVELTLSGDESGIDALAGVYVSAELYYAPKLNGEHYGVGIAAADLNLTVSGTAVSISAVYMGSTVYISINQIGNTAFTDLKLKASAYEIESAIEQIVALLADTDVLDFAGSLIGAFSSTAAEKAAEDTVSAQSEESEAEESESLTLAGIITTILTLNAKGIISAYYEKDETANAVSYTLKVDVTALLEAFGLDTDAGTLTAVYSTTGDFSVSITKTAEDNTTATWASLAAGKTDKREYAVENSEYYSEYYIDTEEYMNLDFIGDFVSDLAETLTNTSGEVYGLYSFTGSASIDISFSIISATINLDITTLTAGLDESGYPYLTLLAKLSATKVLTYQVTQAWNIAVNICYYNGTPYITLGRQVGTEAEKYKVMTLAYFIDNMLDSYNSPLRWMLGTSGSAWSLIMGFISVDVSSGLTTPQSLYLYEQSSHSSASAFALASYITSILYMNGSNDTTVLGSSSGIADTFNYDNYYGFELSLGDLTGGVLDTVYAAILRGTYSETDEENGLGIKDSCYISGLALYAEISSYATISVDLGTYLEGVTDTYGTTTTMKEENVSSETDFYEYIALDGLTASEYAAGAGEGVEYFTGTTDESGNTTYESVLLTDDNDETYYADFDYDATYYYRTNDTYYVKSGSTYVLASAYEENATYYIITDLENVSDIDEVAAPNYLAYVLDNFKDDSDNDISLDGTGGATDGDNTTAVFGCFSTETGTYDASYMLSTVTLTMYNGGESEEYSLTYGSTVYLVDCLNPVWANDEKTSIVAYYGDSACTDSNYLGENITLTENTTIYRGSKSGYVAVAIMTNITDSTGKAVTQAIAVASGDCLPDYAISGYTSLGWYSDSSFSTDFSGAITQATTVYGKYALTSTTISGVVYTLEGSGSTAVYSVTGYEESSLKSYYLEDKWLVLESAIDGISVTSIEEKAFAYASLKNIVVPSTITSVGSLAFLDNIGMLNAVFLADTVTFYGSVGKSSSGGYPFYGCVESSSSNLTSLNVYYNKIVSANGDTNASGESCPAWAHVRSYKDNSLSTSYKYRYIGHNGGTLGSSLNGSNWYEYSINDGSRVTGSSNAWAYVEYALASNSVTDYSLSSLGLTGGAVTTAMTEEELAAAIVAQLDVITAESKSAVNVYSVEVSPAITLDYGSHKITINITQNAESEWQKQVNVSYTFVFLGGETTTGGSFAEGYTASTSLYRSGALPESSNVSEVDGYTFLGWYSDEACTERLDVFDGKSTTIYGLYAANSVTESNGITYTLTYDSTYGVAAYGGYSYWATSFSTSSVTDGTDYTSTSSWLIIANTVNNIPVTVIGEKAFDNSSSSNKSSTSIKNIVVPENVVLVKSLAFLDNVGMLNAIFLADKVTFCGSVGSGSSGAYPFYGCNGGDSGDSNSEYSNLNVYYNVIVDESGSCTLSSDGVPNWAHFRSYVSGTSTKYRYIGHNGGSLGSSLNGTSGYWYSINDSARNTGENSSWAYVTYELAGDSTGYSLSALGLYGGLVTTAATADEIASAVLEKLNALTAADSGCINYYAVTVDKAIELNGAITITVTLTAQESLAYYKLTISSSEDSITVVPAYSISGTALGESDSSYEEYIKTYNGATYVKYGVTVTLSDSEQSEVFTRDTLTYTYGSNTESYTEGFCMPAAAVTVNVTYKANYAGNVYVYSAVDFTYAGVDYTASTDGVKLTNAAIGAALNTPAAEGYTFVAWATADGETLTAFTDSITESDTAVYYYCLWAVSRDEVSYTTDGVTVSATMNSGYNGSVYGWYAASDSDFTDTCLGTDSSFTFTTENTVVRVRLNYKLTLAFGGNSYATTGSTNIYYRETVNSSGTDSTEINRNNNDGSFSASDHSITLLEGQYVRLDMDGNHKVLFVFILDSADTEVATNGSISGYRFRGFKSSYTYDDRYMMYSSQNKYAYFTAGTWYASNSYGTTAISPDTAYAAETSYTISGTTFYYGAMAQATQNLTVAFNL